METIYKTKVKSIGELVNSFIAEKIIILFGDKAPQELKDFCYNIELVNINGEIYAGQKFYINNEAFEITSVGSAVQHNLATLGHITLCFNGAVSPELPGTLYLENKKIPKIELGSEIKIV
jgi:PTS system glucitol/sorbitol-specific IIA component